MDTGTHTTANTPDLHTPADAADLEDSQRVRPAEVYGELRRRLMMGEFPLRARLVEDRLAALLGVSRTPVREAMRRLLSDGLVTRIDGGYFVAIPDFTGLRDLYELRTTLELRGVTRALESPGLKHDLGVLEVLRDEWREMWVDRPEPAADFVVMDEDFHVTLLRAAGNEVLCQTLESVNARIRPVRIYDYLTEERIELTISQHLVVVEAVLADRLDDAAVALRDHVGESMDVVERRAARALTQMALGRGGMQ